MSALVAEHFDHQVGGAVHDLWSVDERRLRVDEPAKPHNADDLVEIAERGLDLGEEIDPAGAGGLLAVLNRHRLAQLSPGNERSASPDADLARDDEQGSRAHKADIIGDRGCWRRQSNTEIRKLLLNLGHDALLCLTSRSILRIRPCLG